MVAGEVQTVYAQAFHGGDERHHVACGNQQALEFVGCNHDNGVMPADGDMLRTITASASNDLAKARLVSSNFQLALRGPDAALPGFGYTESIT